MELILLGKRRRKVLAGQHRLDVAAQAAGYLRLLAPGRQGFRRISEKPRRVVHLVQGR